MNSTDTPLYQDPAAPIADRAADLLSRMTVEEKALQLVQQTIGRDINPNNIGPDTPFDPRVGSVQTFMGGAKARNAFQRVAVERTRLGIPLVWAYDVIHGWRTGFPAALAQAASFNPALTEALSAVAAREAWADAGIDWTFSPMVEVCHDPRWGRVVEGYGEDPHVAGAFAAAAVRGYQGRTPEGLAEPGRIAACLKHFVGYSASEGGRDYSYTDVSERALHEWYLPPFEAGVRAGAATVMSSFNDLGGTPVVANGRLLTDLLRGAWGFEGAVVTDWGAIGQLARQGYSADPDEQALAALLAGNDMDMCDGVFRARLAALVASGRLPEAALDRAVARVLRLKFALGLFERPYVPEKPTAETCRRPADLALALDCARESIALLKNDGILPLDPAAPPRRIALVGPLADARFAHIGSWRGMVAPEDAATLREAVAARFPTSALVVREGCPFVGTDVKDILLVEAARAAAECDLVLFACGEDGGQSGEYRSRSDIGLPGRQAELLERLLETGKPVVALVAAGRPLAIGRLLEKCAAVLYLWQSGEAAARAAAEILAGDVNPSAKLPMTFPRCVGQIPVYYNAHSRARGWAKDYTGDFADAIPDGPLLPFGHGLSYTSFEYGAVKVSSPTSQVASPATCDLRPATYDASVTVCNTGTRAGKEVVIWYLTDEFATFTQPVRRVVGFEKIELAPGEEKTVSLSLDPERDFSCVRPDGSRVLGPGFFRLSASLRAETRFELR